MVTKKVRRQTLLNEREISIISILAQSTLPQAEINKYAAQLDLSAAARAIVGLVMHPPAKKASTKKSKQAVKKKTFRKVASASKSMSKSTRVGTNVRQWAATLEAK